MPVRRGSVQDSEARLHHSDDVREAAPAPPITKVANRTKACTALASTASTVGSTRLPRGSVSARSRPGQKSRQTQRPPACDLVGCQTLGRGRTVRSSRSNCHHQPARPVDHVTAIDLTDFWTPPASISSCMVLVCARRAWGSVGPQRSMSTGYSGSRLSSAHPRPCWRTSAGSRTGRPRARSSVKQSTRSALRA